MSRAGTLYGVGVGPGDPELLTFKAVRVLREVDSIYYPCHERGDESLAFAIVSALELPAEKFEAVSLSMSRARGADLAAYEAIGRRIVADLQQGRSAAWITEGDPLCYSTFIYIRQRVLGLWPQATVEIVPGITSFQAAAARAGVAVAGLDQRFAVVPAAYGLANLTELLAQFATLFLIKIHTQVECLLDQLAALPFPVHSVYLEWIGTDRERIVTDLTTLRGMKLPYFSLVILQRAEVQT
jgi:precorrin-2/cobalt-factor-2 C20-methyltransferase